MPGKPWATQDGISNAARVIDHAHHKIHNGDYYTASYSEVLADGSVGSLLVTVGAAKIPHLTFSISATGAGFASFSEAPNASGGTTVAVNNNNRSSGNTSDSGVTSDPTFVSAGTVFRSAQLGAQSPSFKNGGETESRVEWPLNIDTLYLLRFVASAAAAIEMVVEYYEVDA